MVDTKSSTFQESVIDTCSKNIKQFASNPEQGFDYLANIHHTISTLLYFSYGNGY